MLLPVLYYTPGDATAPPAHVRRGLPPFRTVEGGGPDGRGGIAWGLPYDPAHRARWKRTGAGWWFLAPERLDQLTLDRCGRLDAPPCALAQHDGLTWRVPRLLTRRRTIPEHLTHYVGALDADGNPTVLTHIRHQDMAERLAAYFDGVRLVEGDIEANNAAVLRLAADVAGLAYHLSAFELFGLGLATWAWADLILSTAADCAVGPDGQLPPEAVR